MARVGGWTMSSSNGSGGHSSMNASICMHSRPQRRHARGSVIGSNFIALSARIRRSPGSRPTRPSRALSLCSNWRLDSNWAKLNPAAGPSDGSGPPHLVLKHENIGKLLIVAFRPDVVARDGIHELGTDT